MATSSRKAASSSTDGRGRAPRADVGFLGAGNAASALGAAAARAGLSVVFASRSAASARAAARRAGPRARAVTTLQALARSARVLILAVPDRAVAEASRDLAPHVRRGSVVAHLCGSLGASALSACRARGASVASFHPIQTFPDRKDGASKVRGACAGIEGDAAATRALERFARRIGMTPLRVRAGRRPRYHAASVLAANGTVALLDLAVEQFVSATGVRETAARVALLSLLAGAVENLRTLGLPAALSGPVSRGDVETVRRHVRALGTGDAARAYGALGRRMVSLALRKGSIDRPRAALLRAILAPPRER